MVGASEETGFHIKADSHGQIKCCTPAKSFAPVWVWSAKFEGVVIWWPGNSGSRTADHEPNATLRVRSSEIWATRRHYFVQGTGSAEERNIWSPHTAI